MKAIGLRIKSGFAIAAIVSKSGAGCAIEAVRTVALSTTELPQTRFPYHPTIELPERQGTALSDIVAGYPRYSIVKDKLDRPAAPLDAVYATLKKAFPDAEVDTQDGLRLTWADRWVHVRPSGTEPIVRVIAEAPTVEEAGALISKCREPLDELA